MRKADRAGRRRARRTGGHGGAGRRRAPARIRPCARAGRRPGAGTFDSLTSLTTSGSSARSAGNVVARAVAERHLRGAAGLGEGQGRREVQGDGARLVPRRHRRRHRQRHAGADRRADDRAQPRVRRLLRRREVGLQLRARRRHAHRQRRLVLRRHRRLGRAADEAGAPPRRLRDAQRLLDDGRRVSRLGVPAGPARLASLPGRDRLRLGVDAGTSDTYAGRYDLGHDARRTRPGTGSTSSTRSTAAATRRATSSTTRRR